MPKVNKPSDKFKKNEKPKLTIKHTIQNLAQLHIPTAPSDQPSVVPKLPEPKPIGTYFESLKVKSELSTNVGITATIDVQPDSRYITAYLHQAVNQKYKNITTNDNPYVSAPSFIGYNLCLFYFQHLILDMKCRTYMSHSASTYATNTRYKTLISSIMECKVPPELAIELKNLAPVFDPLHSDLEYIPSYACFNMQHDFGRSIPAFVYFFIHNCMSNLDTYETALDLMNQIYQLQILQINGNIRTVSNLFGGPYVDAHQTANHTNWLRKSLERTLLPTFGVCC